MADVSAPAVITTHDFDSTGSVSITESGGRAVFKDRPTARHYVQHGQSGALAIVVFFMLRK